MALLYAVSSAFVAAGMVTLMLGIALASDKTADSQSSSKQANFLASGALESAKKTVQESIANWASQPESGTVQIDGHQATYTVRPTGFSRTVADEAGIQTIETGYEIRAVATEGGVPSQAFRVINSLSTPLFQFAVFYDGDLEIMPGPSMAISGRVHTNQDMYLGSNNTLRLNTNYVHAVGSMFRNRKDDPSQSLGTVNIRKWVANPFSGSEPTSYFRMDSKSQLGGVPSSGGYDAHFTSGYDGNGDGDFLDVGDWLPWGPGAQTYWAQPSGYAGGTGQTVQDASHGVNSSAPPPIESISMYEPAAGGVGDWSLSGSDWTYTPGAGTHQKGFYHSNAGLTIVANAAHTGWTAYNSSGVDVTSSIPAGAVTLSSIYDARQAGGSSGSSTKVKVIKVDMSILQTSTKWPTNGLLYFGCNGTGTGTNAKGVQLVNGSSLPGKLTVVTDGSMYVQGNYNTSAKKGCALIGDAVNLLSNAWNGTKAKGTGVPNASATTYNAAIVTGNTNTVAGSVYSGGFENLPRFHENWAGVNCNITGSFVNFWNSKYATGPWGLSGVYSAPNRVWGYDPFFNTVANLPPFTPMAVVAVDVVCW